jgi:uncharacterized protein (UPF0212 family)
MWIVMNTGCLECGVSSKVVGVFADKALADSMMKTKQYESHDQEQHSERIPKPSLWVARP